MNRLLTTVYSFFEVKIVYCFAGIYVNVTLQKEELKFANWRKYQCSNDSGMESIHVNILNMTFPTRMIPQHEKFYSGILTRESNGISNTTYLYYFKDGNLLFMMQQDTAIRYNVYVHTKDSISYQTAVQYVILLEGIPLNILGLHAVTLSLHKRSVMISAPSGTGKTTHSELWRKEFNAEIINGDYALLECRNNKVIFHGTPFCGSSHYAKNGIWSINDIVFIKQANMNKISKMENTAAVINTMENCFIPTWDKIRMQLCLDLIDYLLKNTHVWLLECNMNPEAAYVAHDAIFSKE